MNLDERLFDESTLVRASDRAKNWLRTFTSEQKLPTGVLKSAVVAERLGYIRDASELLLLDLQQLAHANAENSREYTHGYFFDLESRFNDLSERRFGTTSEAAALISELKSDMDKVIPGLAHSLGDADLSLWANCYIRLFDRFPENDRARIQYIDSDSDYGGDYHAVVGAKFFVSRMARRLHLKRTLRAEDVGGALADTLNAISNDIEAAGTDRSTEDRFAALLTGADAIAERLSVRNGNDGGLSEITKAFHENRVQSKPSAAMTM